MSNWEGKKIKSCANNEKLNLAFVCVNIKERKSFKIKQASVFIYPSCGFLISLGDELSLSIASLGQHINQSLFCCTFEENNTKQTFNSFNFFLKSVELSSKLSFYFMSIINLLLYGESELNWISFFQLLKADHLLPSHHVASILLSHTNSL